jgi:hypothetical protein
MSSEAYRKPIHFQARDSGERPPLTSAQIELYRERIAANEPVARQTDSPGLWERAEAGRSLKAAARSLFLFLELSKELEENAEAEVTSRKLAAIVQVDFKPRVLYPLFGVPPSSPVSASSKGRAYCWRDVRRKAHRLMVSRIIRRLAESLAKELGDE